MLRISFRQLSNTSKTGRAIVRDPRKKRPRVSSALVNRDEEKEQGSLQETQSSNPLPFAPPESTQQSLGSTLGSYMVMGAGVSLGFAVVGALFG
jgi:hypothetical protein